MDQDDHFERQWPAGEAIPVPDDAQRCVWCQGELQPGEGGFVAPAPGVCDACAAVLISFKRESIQSFLEKVAAPVLLVTGDGVAELANGKARAYLGRSAETVAGRRQGDVIHCVHAAEPGGCGQTVHCSGCALRRSVEHTHATGEPLQGVHAYQDLVTPVGIRRTWFEVSTENVGGLVLLRFDRIGVERRV